MARLVDTYRDLYRGDLSAFHPVKGEKEILDGLEQNWKAASEESANNKWPPEQRAARRIWAGIGFLVFGCLHHFRETLETIKRFPQAATSLTCRYYVPAIDKLLPLPTNISSTGNLNAVLDWFQSNSVRLQWEESEGKFVHWQLVVLDPHGMRATPRTAIVDRLVGLSTRPGKAGLPVLVKNQASYKSVGTAVLAQVKYKARV
jgi:hypothetical protein